jgi:hypothetical protein
MQRYASRPGLKLSAKLFGSVLDVDAQFERQGRNRVSDDAHKPRISTAIRAAIVKPLKFYFAVPSVDLTNWLVVEAGNPEQPMAQLFSSEVEAWAVADALNDRELKVRSFDVRQAQQASDNADHRT